MHDEQEEEVLGDEEEYDVAEAIVTRLSESGFIRDFAARHPLPPLDGYDSDVWRIHFIENLIVFWSEACFVHSEHPSLAARAWDFSVGRLQRDREEIEWALRDEFFEFVDESEGWYPRILTPTTWHAKIRVEADVVNDYYENHDEVLEQFVHELAGGLWECVMGAPRD